MNQFAQRRAEFNRKVTNRLVAPISGWVPMWSVVEHVGRRSGKTYRTPVSMFRTADGVAILLPYGTATDWVRNLQAANGGRVKVGGESFEVSDPQIVPTSDAAASVKPPWRQMMTTTGVKSAMVLRRR